MFAWRHRQFFYVSVFPLSSLVIVQVWYQHHDWFWSYDNFCLWRSHQKSGNQIHLSELFPIYGDWGKSRIPNLQWKSLIKSSGEEGGGEVAERRKIDRTLRNRLMYFISKWSQKILAYDGAEIVPMTHYLICR